MWGGGTCLDAIYEWMGKLHTTVDHKPSMSTKTKDIMKHLIRVKHHKGQPTRYLQVSHVFHYAHNTLWILYKYHICFNFRFLVLA